MRLKLDENLGNSAAELFRSAGHDTETTRGQGMSEASDRELIAACQIERRCLVTLDMDFSNPLLFDPAKHSGIAVMRLRANPSRQDLMDASSTLIASLAKRDIAGRLWVVQRGRIREYQPEEPGR